MLERGSAAKSALSVFYENFNDVDIYVEDTAEGYDKIFSRLLGRALDGQISIDRVFPLGDRDKVASAARASLEQASERTSIYIVDGDLYLLCGELQELPTNLIVLPRYCIENFLFSKEAIIELLDEEDISKDKAALEHHFAYEEWIASADQTLRPLFVIFSVSHYFDSGIKTVGNGSTSICGDDGGNIDPTKVTALYERIYLELCANYGICVIEAKIQEITLGITPGICFASTYVSGKDFILPLLFLRIRKITGSKTKYINLKIRLANKSDITPLSSVATKIMSFKNSKTSPSTI